MSAELNVPVPDNDRPKIQILHLIEKTKSKNRAIN
jgi:hypothetical protein